MLSNKECKQATAAWRSAKSSYSSIKNYIFPNGVFQFSPSDCNWIKTHNDNNSFFAYAGIHNEKLVLIIIPLDDSGNEKKLSEYIAIPLSRLNHPLHLIEKKKTTQINKTTLSENLTITKITSSLSLPIMNEPTISEFTSVEEIESWKNNSLDWFYKECTDYKGKRIFNFFKVPLSDLRNNTEVVSLFALKNTPVYNRLVPILIFAAIDKNTLEAQFIYTDDSTTSNIADWSTPCPPFCRDRPEDDSLMS